jgi:hypothetical protein
MTFQTPTGKLISTWSQVDPNELIWSQTFLFDQVGDNLIPNIHDIKKSNYDIKLKTHIVTNQNWYQVGSNWQWTGILWD